MPRPPEQIRAAAALHKQRHPERVRARQATADAIRRGRLVRPSACQRCGKECKPEASHNDYGRRFEVEWLCKPCHAAKDAANPTPTSPTEYPIMTATPDKPWPHPWPKGGRPPKITNAQRWNLYVDASIRADAEARARDAGTELPDVMRALMADYAAGRVTPSGHPEPVSEATR
jgi:hypothetical protein